jgi:hypothetical protein
MKGRVKSATQETGNVQDDAMGQQFNAGLRCIVVQESYSLK